MFVVLVKNTDQIILPSRDKFFSNEILIKVWIILNILKKRADSEDIILFSVYKNYSVEL